MPLLLTRRPAPASKSQAAAPTAASPAAPEGQSHRHAAAKAPRSPSRVGKRAAVAWVEPEVVKRLGILAIEEDTTVQGLLAEAIGLLFADRARQRPARSR